MENYLKKQKQKTPLPNSGANFANKIQALKPEACQTDFNLRKCDDGMRKEKVPLTCNQLSPPVTRIL